MKYTVLVIVSLFYITCTSQTKKRFNLDFETYDSLLLFPEKWFEWGDYSLNVDSVNVHSGRYASKITSKENVANSFGCIAYRIPANYKGESIKLEGYMKTKNIEKGYAGLMLRIDGGKKILAGDNMEKQNIHGTKDWQKYTVTLTYPENAENIIVAGIMSGTGEAWFDEFVLTIDGQDVQTLKEIEQPVYKATLDNEFDLNSKIEFPELNEELVSNLELLGKVWGFLKYNHPEVGKGNYNWDFELFRILPNFLKVKGNLERDKVILEWIKKYGEIDACAKCIDTKAVSFVKPDMLWLEGFSLSSELKNKINYIYKNRFQGKHYYIDKGPTGNPNFVNEKYYYSMLYNDDGFKLLALYRYWNMIHYFFPYKHLTDKDWSKVLKEYIPEFIKSEGKLEYEKKCILLISDINDTHATTSVGFNNVTKKRGEFYPPFKVEFVEDKLVVTDYYNPELKETSKVEVGDVITHINNKSVEFIVDSISPYYPASNGAAKMRDISKDLLRFNKKNIDIDFISNEIKKHEFISFYPLEQLNTKWYKWTGEKSYKLLENNIGYVTLKSIKTEDIPILKETFENTKGIIIDIRNYPSAFVPYKLGSYFVSSRTPFVKIAKFNKDNPGEFNFSEPLNLENDTITYKGKLVVLVNEYSQSQSEFTAMAFRAGENTTIVGSTTAGADGSVSDIYLPGGLLTRISGNGIYYPDGAETQRIGIVPDVVIRPTVEGIKKGRDEVLEKAIEILNY
ncbi:S41 family peptidase [Algibacter sp. L4_22]|uniref:S41 family peptidase n=1 Tax=Algibacter sp. L4_22 TaxID=2942477 RepID=UPI00201B6EE0|nr:S41 family peptidase [Algibacter sp. L4_22]MCL5128580.1 S41 family peptidase [Algibacter sp. L4_22]